MLYIFVFLLARGRKHRLHLYSVKKIESFFFLAIRRVNRARPKKIMSPKRFLKYTQTTYTSTLKPSTHRIEHIIWLVLSVRQFHQ